MNKPTLIFFGTPEVAVPTLRALKESGKYEILAVVSQTDKISGRGKTLLPSPIKTLANSYDLEVFQPKTLAKIQRLDSGELVCTNPADDQAVGFVRFLNSNAVDLFVVVAYGKIIPPALLNFPKNGIINIHFSLLPRWRGAAPVQHAILAGDKETGVCIMKIDEGLDCGGIFAVERLPIGEKDTTGSLKAKLADLGSRLLLKTIDEILYAELMPTPQAAASASYAEKLDKSFFAISWQHEAAKLTRLLRAGEPEPGAYTTLNGETVKIFAAHVVANKNYPPAEPGTVVESNKAELIVAVGDSQYIAIEEMQFAGKKRLPIADILRGRRIDRGSRFGT